MAQSVVADTHAVIWYLAGSTNLSEPARDAMRTAVEGGDRIYVSAITLVEIVYLTERERIPRPALERLTGHLRDPASAFSLVPIDLDVALAVDNISRTQVADMPDRIVAATALVLRAPLVTADRQLRAADIETIW